MATDQAQEHPLLSLSKEKQQTLVDLVEDGNIDAIAEATGYERRDILKIAAALGVGTIAGGMSAQELISEARAAASTTDSDGNVGLPGDRVDVFAESADVSGTVGASAVDTDKQSLTDPTLLYVYGENSTLLSYRDPSNFSDVFAAANDVIASIQDSRMVTLKLPFTGVGGVSAATTLEVPAATKVPNIIGHGQDATVINYTATDGTPAIKVNDAGNDVAPEWTGFMLSGPGKSASGGGNGIDIDGTLSHGSSLHGFGVEEFPGDGINIDGYITGVAFNMDIQHNGQRGLVVERHNGGWLAGNLIQKNGNGNGVPQVLLRDCINGVFGPGNVVDSRGGDGTLTREDGLIARAVNKRGAPTVFGNYFEDNTTHVRVENGGVSPRAFNCVFNTMQQGDTGVHVANDLSANGDRGGTCWGNEFTGAAVQDILLDGGDIVLGPNQHVNSTVVLTDNTGGDYASLSKNAGSYNW